MRSPKGENKMYSAKMTDTKRAVIFCFITVAYMGLIFYLSSQNFNLPKLPTNSDKLIHACIYFPLAFLFYSSLRKCGIKKYIFTVAFILAGIYGITDEFHQSFIPGRDASVGDVFADFTGALLGSLGASIFKM
jgi:VanZ family protein